jgi:serine/threonine-protein kinase
MARCAACHRENVDGARFCAFCSAPQSGTASAVVDPPTSLSSHEHGDLDVTGGPAPSRPSRDIHSASGWLSSSDAISHGRFAPGEVLDRRYRIVGLLGKGGMGEVYRADDLKLGQPVALKFLPAALVRDPTRLAQFHSEVRLTRQVTHPNVCRVYDIGEANGEPFISMEYVDGEDLATLLRRIGRLPEDKAIEISRQLCAGLAAAHDRGVLHRDLKPANVMLDGRGQVRVMDFGLAGLGESGEQIRAGTPGYMAPEQLAGREVSIRSDIYALGLVLFELFTGRRVFEAKNIAELVQQHERGATTPSSVLTSIDPTIERAIMRCLEEDPLRRPASVRIVAASLPGGDALAAAVAAGETPSPEMVAAAGESAVVNRRTLVVAAVSMAIGLAAAVFLAHRSSLLRFVPFEKSIDVLADRADQIRQRLGYREAAVDTAHGFGVVPEYETYLLSTDASRNRWEHLRAGRPPVLVFWYRTSPRDLVPLSQSARTATNDPPLTISGMTEVVLDLRGRLMEFLALPPQREDATTPAPPTDWRAAFEVAELPFDQFRSVAPTWTPRGYADTRSAWEGILPETPDVTVRIEASSYRGRLVSFQVIGPWTRPARQQAAQRPLAMTVLSAAVSILLLLCLASAVWLARRNIRAGRGDRRGASRLAFFIIAIGLIDWTTYARHFFDVNVEIGRLALATGNVLFGAALLWALYLALEPFVRRTRPESLVGWTRLVSGTIRDVHVGRDLLAGIGAGLIISVLELIVPLLPELAGRPMGMPRATSTGVLLFPSALVSVVLDRLISALTAAMLAVFALTIAQAMVKRRVAGMSITFAVFVLLAFNSLDAQQGWMTVTPFAIAIAAVMIVVITRFGLLAAVVTFFLNGLLGSLPLTPFPSDRTFAVSAWTIAFIAALLTFAIVAAGRSEPAMPRGLAREVT